MNDWELWETELLESHRWRDVARKALMPFRSLGEIYYDHKYRVEVKMDGH